MPRLALALFGPVAITLDSQPLGAGAYIQARALLVYLALEAARPQQRDLLAALFWPDQSSSAARTNLRQALAHLRALLGDRDAPTAFLLATRDTIQFNSASDFTLDVAGFSALLEQVNTHAHADLARCAACIERLERAVGLYAGDLLVGFSVPGSYEFDEWALLRREALHRSAVDALARLGAAYERQNAHVEVCRVARRQLALDPWSEEAHRRLMRALYLAGERASALAQYERCRQTLHADLGIEPAPETTALYEYLRQHALPVAAATPAAAAVAEPAVDAPHVAPEVASAGALDTANPYKGLRAFVETDAADFFGRELLTDQLLSRLSEPSPLRRFLAVVGPSGSGKSSVVRAGLLPVLRRRGLPGSEQLVVAVIIAGAHPLTELALALQRIAPAQAPAITSQLAHDERGLVRAAAALLPAGAELVLVIDQFEELFTLVADQEVRELVLAQIHNAVRDPASRVRVIITLRADFFDRPLQYQPFAELLRQRTVLVLPMTAEELLRAIVSPAERAGVTLADDLVAAILHDVGARPGTLPLLQYALTELFERRDGRLLTLEAYRASGGVARALNQRAEAVYDGLDPSQQEVARQLFLRLVTLGEGAEDTRRRVSLAELELTPLLPPSGAGDAERPKPVDASQATLFTVMERYGHYRLLTFDRDPQTDLPTVELAHEALLHDWKRLHAWIAQTRGDLQVQRRLLNAAGEWAMADHDASFLASGSRLAQFEALAQNNTISLNAQERAYLDASLAERERLGQRELARQQRELQLARQGVSRLRWLVGGLLAFSLLVSGLSLFAYAQQQAAATSALLAQGQALASGAQAALAEANLDQARALALAAVEVSHPAPEAEAILSQAAYAPGTRQLFAGHGDAVLAVAYGADGRSLLSGSSDRTLRLWDAQSGAEIRRFTGLAAIPHGVAVSPDGRQVLAGAEDGVLYLWDASDGEQPRHLVGHSGAVYAVAFGSDGRNAFSASEDATVRMWDLATGRLLQRFSGHAGAVWSLAVSPDGRQLISGGADNSVRLWDVATGQELQRFSGHANWVQAVAFSPDGKQALSGSIDETVRLWDLASGQQQLQVDAFDGSVRSVAFSPAGQAFASASANLVHVWGSTSGQELQQLNAHGDEVFALAFSPNGQQILSGSRDTTLRLWDLGNGAEIRQFGAHTSWIRGVAMSPDGRMAASGAWDWEIRLWDVASGEQRHLLEGHTDGVEGVAFSPDGQTLLSASDDRTLRLWDITTGAELRRFDGHSSYVWDVVFSPDGASAFSGSEDRTIRQWDVARGQELQRFEGHSAGVESIAVSPDGRQLLSGSADASLRLWDIASGQELRRFTGHSGTVSSVAFSPDGQQALSGSADGSARLWDVASGRDLQRFPKQSGPVLFVRFSPDGRQALFGTGLSLVALWDVASGRELRRFDSAGTLVYSGVFSPDGQTVLAGLTDGTSRLWRIDALPELKTWLAYSRYLPELTCAQRARYQIQPLCDS